RMNTDPEDVLRDTIEFLGYSLGVNKEQLLMAEAVQTDPGILRLNESGSNFDISFPIELQHEFQKRVGGQEGNRPLWCVIHPFQAREVMKELVEFGGAQAALNYRERAIAGWTVPGF